MSFSNIPAVIESVDFLCNEALEKSAFLVAERALRLLLGGQRGESLFHITALNCLSFRCLHTSALKCYLLTFCLPVEVFLYFEKTESCICEMKESFNKGVTASIHPPGIYVYIYISIFHPHITSHLLSWLYKDVTRREHWRLIWRHRCPQWKFRSK